MATYYRARVERALRYIAEHRAEPLRLADVARVARLSEFHFHRIFASVMGESVARFIARSRLEHAACRLAYEPDRSITEIALESGYSSPSNFSKAFSAHFGCAPSRVRRSQGGLPRAVGERIRRRGAPLDPAALYALPTEASAAERRRRYSALSRRVRFERRDALDLACLASPAGYDLAAQHATWQELIERARQLGIAEQGIDAYGLAYDSPQLTVPELCRYHAGVGSRSSARTGRSAASGLGRGCSPTEFPRRHRAFAPGMARTPAAAPTDTGARRCPGVSRM
jgi:AraC family transcriptional regulator